MDKVARSYSFKPISTPIIENTGLFSRSLGKETDIVDKQMFSFTDKGRDKITLRPENTAGIARAYIETGMHNLPQPVKLFYQGPMFRYEQPQTGRLRQFYQFGLEILGSASSSLDAELIFVANLIFKALGLKDIVTQVNSIGCLECRLVYKNALVNFYRGQTAKLCPDCRRRLRLNPLRVLDCKNPKCQKLSSQAPQIVDFFCKDCHRDFKLILEHLDGLGINYELNPSLVRGLDYYSRTVFEFVPKDKKQLSQGSIGAGGRYDYLIEVLGGRSVPAVGLALGIERVINLIKEQKVKLPSVKPPQVFLAQLGNVAKIKSLKLFEEFRQNRLIMAESFGRDSIKSQLKQANRLAVKFVLILGHKEALDNTILLRDMASGVQEVVKLDKVIAEIKRRLRKIKKQAN